MKLKNFKIFIYAFLLIINALNALDNQVKPQLEKAIKEGRYKEVNKIVLGQTFSQEEKDYYLEFFKQNNKQPKLPLKWVLGIATGMLGLYADILVSTIFLDETRERYNHTDPITNRAVYSSYPTKSRLLGLGVWLGLFTGIAINGFNIAAKEFGKIKGLSSELTLNILQNIKTEENNEK